MHSSNLTSVKSFAHLCVADKNDIQTDLQVKMYCALMNVLKNNLQKIKLF